MQRPLFEIFVWSEGEESLDGGIEVVERRVEETVERRVEETVERRVEETVDVDDWELLLGDVEVGNGFVESG